MKVKVKDNQGLDRRTSVCTHMVIHLHIQVCALTRTPPHTHKCTHTLTHSLTHNFQHTHTHTHTHTHIHTSSSSSLSSSTSLSSSLITQVCQLCSPCRWCKGSGDPCWHAAWKTVRLWDRTQTGEDVVGEIHSWTTVEGRPTC